MLRSEVLAEYDVDVHGIIRSPGKFEGCMLYVPALWSAILEGCGDGMEGDDGDNSERIKVTDEDRAEFPELHGFASCVLWETDQGFVMCAEEEINLSDPEQLYGQPFMAFVGKNDCTGNRQWLHFDGEYSRIVEFSDDDGAQAYRDALATETAFLRVAVQS